MTFVTMLHYRNATIPQCSYVVFVLTEEAHDAAVEKEFLQYGYELEGSYDLRLTDHTIPLDIPMRTDG